MNKLEELKNLKYYANLTGHSGIVERVDSIINLFNNYNIDEEEDFNHNPLYIVWSITHNNQKALKYQISQLLQHARLLPSDFIHFVCDKRIKRDVYTVMDNAIKENINNMCIWTVTGVDRKFQGQSDILNWEIGLYEEDSTHHRLLFLKDNLLFFDVDGLIQNARKADLNYINNFSTVIGQHIAYLSKDWSWSVHSKLSPTPTLNAWVADGNKLKEIGGFDIKFRLGSGYLGELDLLLRWALNKDYVSYKIIDSSPVLKIPILINDSREKESLDKMVSATFPIFRDKYGAINHLLQSPFRLDLSLMKVTDALTFSPFSNINWEDSFINIVEKLGNHLLDDKRDIYDFHKPDLNIFRGD